MSWFGDTFGDSLNTLKGQITKITKEVLADEETANNKEGEESQGELVKELEAVCESKDIEIATLREELNKFQNSTDKQLEIVGVEQLKKELVQLREERDHLNSCLDELQTEHQVNLNEVISIRDRYKAELEELKKEYNSVRQRLNEDKINEVSLLNSKIEELQNEVQQYQKEKEEQGKSIQKEVQDQDGLKQKLDKLVGDIQVLNSEKQKIEECNKKIETENQELKNQLNLKEKESEIKIKVLLNEKEELLNNAEDQEKKLSNLLKTQEEIETKLKNLLVTDGSEGVSMKNVMEVISVIDSKLKSLQKNNEKVKELKEENESLQKAVKTWNEKEKNHQEEVSALKKTLADMKEKSQDCLNESQTDDVKRLEQEIANFMSLMLAKNNEINNYSKSLRDLEQELENLKSASSNIEEELTATKKEKKTLEDELERYKKAEEEVKAVEVEKSNLQQVNAHLKSKTDELEKQILELTEGNDRMKSLQEELEKAVTDKTNAERVCGEMQKANADLKKDFENLKAQLIVKETGLSELMKANAYFQEEVNKLQSQNNEMQNSEREMKKWKDASVDLEVQRQELESECLRLKGELELSAAKDQEIQQLKQTNANLLESCNQLHHQLESRAQTEHQSVEQENELQGEVAKQSEVISELQEENAELKSRIQKFQEQMKMQMINPQNQKEDVQQHRRSKSEVDMDMQTTSEEIIMLKQLVQQEQAKYRLLQQQFQEISDKEASARKEFERLRLHLIEVEEHYTEEAVENEKEINDLKSKLIAAEEQLQNSSTLYTSLKVRDNQHLESLQSQIRLVSAQRDDLQTKLSVAEDEVQKHKASLMSLQIVLEHFQQDKEREMEEVAMKYEKQIEMTHGRFRELETEIEGLKKQLSEAKNGLKAASRLGEQLEKKTQTATELEQKVIILNEKITELEKNLETANQAQNGKIDKSLIKNLVVGYVLSPNGDRKSQVLRIMASVLDFDQEERNKMGVDSSSSGWLSNILHPKGGTPTNQSLSEAFIKFLENESRPQPQLKLLPEQFQNSVSTPSRTSPKPPARISELTLPTFNSSQENESTILKNVLKDS